MQKFENTVHMNDVNHEASWLALSNAVRQLDAHAPSCTVTEYGELIERRPLSFGSTLHVYVTDESGRLFVEISLMEGVEHKTLLPCF